MECIYCRNEIAAGERYCPYCGGDQTAGQAQQTIPVYDGSMAAGAGQGAGGDTQLLTPDMQYYGYNQQGEYADQQQGQYSQQDQYGQQQGQYSQQQGQYSQQQGQYSQQQGQYGQQGQPQIQYGQSQNQQGQPQPQMQYGQPSQEPADGKSRKLKAGKENTEKESMKKEPDKGKKGKKIIPIFCAIGLAAVLVLLLFFIHSGDSDRIYYLKDNELFMADLGKSKPEGVSYAERYYEDRDDASGYFGGIIKESEDGKYLFYPSELEDGVFSLNYRSLKNVKEDGTKLDGSVVSYELTPGNKVVYLKDNRALYVNDLKENKTKIDGDVIAYWVSEGGDYVAWIVSDNEGTYDLYYQKLSSKNGDKTKIDSYVSYPVAISDKMDVIAYVKDDNLYVCRNFEEGEKVASDLFGSVFYGETKDGILLYYLADECELSAEELIKDDYETESSAESMKQITEDYLQERIFNLYCYDAASNSAAQMDSDVFSVYSVSDSVLLYTKINRDEISRINLSELYGYSDITEVLNGAKEWYFAYKGRTALVDEDMDSFGEFIGSSDGECAYFTIYDSSDRDSAELKRMDLSAKGLGDVSEIDSDVYELEMVHNGKVYYLSDFSSFSGDLYCDGERLLSDAYDCRSVDDGDTLLVRTDYDRRDGSSSLRLYKNGKAVKVADDVYTFRALKSNKIAVLVDYNTERYRGDLLLFNGKKTITIDTDVSAIY